MTFYDVTETIQLQNGSRLNGITADGVTDDKPNLQKYINYVHQLGGGTLLLPGNKTILISSQLTIYSELTFKSSIGKTILKAKGNGVYSFMNCSKNAHSIMLDGIVFDGNEYDATHALIFKGTTDMHVASRNTTIHVTNCTFQNFTKNAQCIYIESIDQTSIDRCSFDNIYGGIFYHKRNDAIIIKNNNFNNTYGHAIHLQGTTPYYCSNVMIEGNHILINKQRKNLRGIHGIYMTCGDENFDGSTSLHEDVLIAGNTIVGPKLSFAAGGSADLFSLKDVTRLKCFGNTAKNSGDLGFAIERCRRGIVSNNTAAYNNSCGISIFGSSDISVIGNVCSFNEQDHNYDNSKKLRAAPYGGIRVEFDSEDVLIDGNHFYGTGAKTRTQKYGIVVKSAIVPIKHHNVRSPRNIKIGINFYENHQLGDIYNTIASTIIEDPNAEVTNFL